MRGSLFSITRQFARTVTAKNPLKSPLSGCSRKPGISISSTTRAASSLAKISRSLTACSALTPAGRRREGVSILCGESTESSSTVTRYVTDVNTQGFPTSQASQTRELSRSCSVLKSTGVISPLGSCT
jgi:hypothetical protein